MVVSSRLPCRMLAEDTDIDWHGAGGCGRRGWLISGGRTFQKFNYGNHMTWSFGKIDRGDGSWARNKSALVTVSLSCYAGAAFDLELSTRCGSRGPGELGPAGRHPAHAGCGHIAPASSRDYCPSHCDFPALLYWSTRRKFSDLCSKGTVHPALPCESCPR